ncbi:MAG: LysM peptidoglycan-binding domain-containing protein [Anaerolineaceae bacterium]
MRRYIYLFLIVVLLAGLLVLPLTKAQAAGSVTGADMISLMNSWRSGYWSNALIEDSALDQCAQWTAEEMAGMGAGGHLTSYGYTDASTRCSGFGFGGGSKTFVTENWAKHYTMTIDILAGYWGDYWHMLPATEQQYRYVGVGIATAGDGSTYYVLHAGAISGDTGESSSVGSGSVPTDLPDGSTPIVNNYVVSFPTSTPDLDGNISHVVKSGETLYTIAVNYGVTIDAIKTLNAMTSNDIYVGDLLKISLKPTPTITPTRTPTVMMPTRTPTQTLIPTTPGPTRTATPTPQPTQLPLLERIDRQYLGFGLLVLSAVGFFVVVFFFFIRPKFKKN